MPCYGAEALAEPEFRQRVEAARAEHRANLAAQLTGGATRIIRVLLDLVSSPATPPTVKARIALAWLAEQRMPTTLQEVEERVAALERSTTVVVDGESTWEAL